VRNLNDSHWPGNPAVDSIVAGRPDHGATGPSGDGLVRPRGATVRTMAELTVAETLPRVYRRVLDAVEQLERLGGRQDAARFRAAAIRVYSGSWDASSHRQLEDVAGRAEAAARSRERREQPRVA